MSNNRSKKTQSISKATVRAQVDSRATERRLIGGDANATEYAGAFPNSTVNDAMTLSQGDWLQGGKYTIVRTLGQGGFGITYLGYEPYCKRHVAIKEFFMKDCCMREGKNMIVIGTGSVIDDVQKYRQKFVKEATLIKSLGHKPHIVNVYDCFEENATIYYVMEYVEGGALFDLVAYEGPLSEARAIGLIDQTAQALSVLHAHHIMHLDVKPNNILLRKDEYGDDDVVLIDFGISKHYDKEGNATTRTNDPYSRGFAPLEQYRGNVLDFNPATDVYSLGATLYYLLTGKCPPEATALADDMDLERPAGISDAVWTVIETSMQRVRRNRYQSMSEMQQALPRKFKNSAKANGNVSDSEEGAIGKSSWAKEPLRVKIMVIIFLVLGVGNLLFLILYGLKSCKSNSSDSSSVSYVDSSAPIPIDTLIGRAELGDVNAMKLLASRYEDGIDQDTIKHFQWLLKAAESDDMSSQLSLAEHYQEGKYTQKNALEAIKWYKKLAYSGGSYATNGMLGIAQIYLEGDGIDKDYEEAYHWLKLASERGSKDACRSIAYMYEHGLYVKQNLETAIHYYELAGTNDDLRCAGELNDKLKHIKDSLEFIRNYGPPKGYRLSKDYEAEIERQKAKELDENGFPKYLNPELDQEKIVRSIFERVQQQNQ